MIIFLIIDNYFQIFSIFQLIFDEYQNLQLGVVNFKINSNKITNKITTMETKELKVSAPEGYEIDKENSTFDCIKFKRIEESKWRDDYTRIISGYTIGGNELEHREHVYDVPGNYDTFATKKQAKSALAMARISQIMANDKRFGGAVTDEEWRDDNSIKYIIDRFKNTCSIDITYTLYHFLAFHTEEQCHLFAKENMDLIKEYLMID